MPPWETKPYLAKTSGTMLANTTRNSVSVTVTQRQTRLTDFPGCRKGYCVSKVKQTIRATSGEQFEFLAEELVNLGQSNKVCVSTCHTWSYQLTTGTVQRSGCLLIVHERKPSLNPTLDGPHFSIFVMASREATVYVPSPQIARRGRFLEPPLRSLCSRVGSYLVNMGRDHDRNDFSSSTLRETGRPPAYLFVLPRSHPNLPGRPAVKAFG